MIIGTPLSNSSTKVMLLGSGELGKEVAISLQRYGVEVIAVDRYENAPAHQIAHRAYTIDMTDGNALEKIIDKEKPDFIVPEIEAIAVDTLAYLEKEKGQLIVPNARAIQLTMNREGIRTLAAEELSLQTSAYVFADSYEVLKEGVNKTVGYPCFIKPTMSSSGKGQSMATNEKELKDAWEYANSSGRAYSGKVIAEAKVDFDYEITLLTVRSLDKDKNIVTSFCQPIGHNQVDGDYIESWQPMAMSKIALKKAQEISKKVTDSLGGQGLFGVELFVKEDDIWFSEVSPRPHDTGMVTMISQRQNEFELHARAILGLPVNIDLLSPSASAVIYGGKDSKDLKFSGLDKALEDKDVEVRLFGKPESFVKRRMGVALASSTNAQEALTKARNAAKDVIAF